MTASRDPRGAGDLAGFAAVDSWVFDLDNTLYPAHTNLFGQIDVRIRAFVERLLSLGAADAQVLQKDYYRRYGTTLRGLMIEHGVAPDEFLEYVHDIDHSVVAEDPRLAAALLRLPGRRFIMTNGSVAHATAVARRLGIADHFDGIFDIVAADHDPKPSLAAFERFWAGHAIDPGRGAMFEDLARNLAPAHANGMRTVLVVPDGTREVFRESWELEGDAAPHVEHITDDLAGFLERVLAAIGR